MLPTTVSRSPLTSALRRRALSRRGTKPKKCNASSHNPPRPTISTARMGGVIQTEVMAAAPAVLRRRSTMLGNTPAWRRHCIRRRRRELCDDPRHAAITARSAQNDRPIAAPNEAKLPFFVVDQMKSFSIGSFAGLLGSLAGMGGGFVMIPMMTAARGSQGIATTFASKGLPSPWWRGGLGLHQHQAHGTSLFAVGTTGLAGALGYGIHTSSGDGEADEAASMENVDPDADTITITTQQQQTRQLEHTPTGNNNDERKGLVELDTALALAATAMITARFGAIASSRLSERTLQRALGAFMICVAPLVPGKAYLEAALREDDDDDPSDPKVQKRTTDHDADIQSRVERLLPASIIGIFSGFLSGMFGVGGGPASFSPSSSPRT
mmetsp:Transcript_799/g.1890  ORF Transcript_799/g.1890 Transcript_799/m.1890 type:complete len:382 (+) Transcript_799:115-1260(+)